MPLSTAFFESAYSVAQFHFLRTWRAHVFILLAAALLFGYALLAPPTDFASGAVVVIERGASARKAADELYGAHVISHPEALSVLLRLFGDGARVQAGTYRFAAPEDAFTVARRLTEGVYGFPDVRVTFFEGETVREMAARAARALPGVSPEAFTAAAGPYEGFLFPDTYLIPPSADAQTVVTMMRENFSRKIAPLQPAIAASGHSLHDLVTLASLVEKEVSDENDRRIVAGILYNRLAKGMPLQVDAVFGYIRGRATYAPSYADLAIDSPYNTYTHTGLPPGPIGNPSLDALDAVLHPKKTPYLYYLTGADGRTHYATTYAGHQANRRRYLN